MIKAERRGGMVMVADRWFPSSKTCSVCGTIQKSLPLAVRQWICPECGSIHDRDVNAARNLLAHGLAVLNGSTANFAECDACGEEDSGLGRKTQVKPTSMKQEVSTKAIYTVLWVSLSERLWVRLFQIQIAPVE
ncbi:MAG: zinc ribbon domain-containing protein [Leptospirillum sp.]|jgi:putative transposase